MSIYMLFFVLLFGFFVQCTKNEEKNSPNPSSISNYSNDSQSISNIDEIPLISNEKFISMISNVIDFKLGDQIVLDSPKTFLQISILFTLIQNSNYSVVTKKELDDEQAGLFMNKKRHEFYNSLGISEEEYITYGIKNTELIQEFLSTNSQLAEIYETVQSYVTD